MVSGFTKVEDALRRGTGGVLLHASNGAPDGIRKLDGIARQRVEFDAESGEDAQPMPIFTVLSSDELDLALGRSNVIHAAVLTGPAGKTFLSRSQTLVQYRLADDDINASAKASLTTAAPDSVPLTPTISPIENSPTTDMSSETTNVRPRTAQQD